jgi:hypothetical protein
MTTLLAAAAAIALAASGVYADPGKGIEKKASGKDNVPHASERVAERKSHVRGEAARSRPADPRQHSRDQSAEKGENRRQTAVDGDRRIERSAERRQTPVKALGEQQDFDGMRQTPDRDFLSRDRVRAIIDGCPPGLAAKNNGCLPPGQSDQLANRLERWNGYEYGPRLFGLSNYAPGRFVYRDGYLLRRADKNGIAGFIPLLGGALSIGNAWPSSYESFTVPDYYVDYFDLGSASSYRFADNVIYRIDPENTAITSVAALLTGDEFVVGQAMPSGYDVYNVPYSYRERYADTADAWYRYSDGYVYRIDPATRVVAAAIDLLV